MAVYPATPTSARMLTQRTLSAAMIHTLISPPQECPLVARARAPPLAFFVARAYRGQPGHSHERTAPMNDAPMNDAPTNATTGLLRGMSNVSYWAADHAAATAWYTELLGGPPYFQMPGYARVAGGRLRPRARPDRRAVRPAAGGGCARWRRAELARRRHPRGPGPAARAGCIDARGDPRARRGLHHGGRARPVRQRARRDDQPALPAGARRRHARRGGGPGGHPAP